MDSDQSESDEEIVAEEEDDRITPIGSDDDEEMQNPEEVKAECEVQFKSADFIMEPKVFLALERYFAAGGAPENVVEMLSQNYVGAANMVNLVAQLLMLTNVPSTTVQDVVESHLIDLVSTHFDPKKADLIFHQKTEGQIDWLPSFITHAPWRSLIYKLSERFPDCLMLNFAIKLISDAGFQNEICSVATVAQQLDIFSKVLCTATTNVVSTSADSPRFGVAFKELISCANQNEHTYLFTQSLFHMASLEPKIGPCVKRLKQELRQRVDALQLGDSTAIQLALFNSGSSCDPAVSQALHAMMVKRSLNPADMSLLHQHYNLNDPPPVELIKDPIFVDLLVDALFKPEGKINLEHKHKYVYLLAYAASVSESYKNGTRSNHNRDQLKETQQAIEKVHNICTSKEASLELLAEIQVLFSCMKYPIAAMGLLHWVSCTVTESGYFKVHTESVPLHLALVDEIVNLQPFLHQRVFDLVVSLFEMPLEDMEVLVQLKLREMLIDRMVHILSKGFALPVIWYIRKRWDAQDTDLSLIRYFVLETIDIVGPPYSAEFVESFLPLVENRKLIPDDTLSEEKQEALRQFLRDATAQETN